LLLILKLETPQEALSNGFFYAQGCKIVIFLFILCLTIGDSLTFGGAAAPPSPPA